MNVPLAMGFSHQGMDSSVYHRFIGEKSQNNLLFYRIDRESSRGTKNKHQLWFLRCRINPDIFGQVVRGFLCLFLVFSKGRGTKGVTEVPNLCGTRLVAHR